MSIKEVYKEYYQCQKVLHYLRNLFPVPFIFRNGKVETKKDYVIEQISEMVKTIDCDQAKFKELLDLNINKLESEEKSSRKVERFILHYQIDLMKKIKQIPNSIDKAKECILALIENKTFDNLNQIYDAMILFNNEFNPSLIKDVIDQWKKEEKYHIKQMTKDPLKTDIFWISSDFHEIEDMVSRYRFREYFRIGEFETSFKEVESNIIEDLTQSLGSKELRPLAYDLWLIGRSFNLINRIRPFINLVLNNFIEEQKGEGGWIDYQFISIYREKSDIHFSNFLTALCSLSLLKISTADDLKKKGIEGAKWLLRSQNPDGYWTNEIIKEEKLIEKPDILVTLLSLEVLLRSGIEGIDYSIEKGIDWLMQQQQKFGDWDDNGIPFPLMTILILEFLTTKEFLSKKLPPYLTMSKGFLIKSIELTLEDNPNSFRLSIIAAYHGLEVFLYEILSQPTINIRIFNTPNKTIGMRAALNEFERYLQSTGVLINGQKIMFRNSLDKLAYYRDEITHKGIDITHPICSSFIEDSVKFVSNYSQIIFGFNFLN